MFKFEVYYTDGMADFDEFYTKTKREYREMFWIIQNTRNVAFYVIDDLKGNRTTVYVDFALEPKTI